MLDTAATYCTMYDSPPRGFIIKNMMGTLNEYNCKLNVTYIPPPTPSNTPSPTPSNTPSPTPFSTPSPTLYSTPQTTLCSTLSSTLTLKTKTKNPWITTNTMLYITIFACVVLASLVTIVIVLLFWRRRKRRILKDGRYQNFRVTKEYSAGVGELSVAHQ